MQDAVDGDRHGICKGASERSGGLPLHLFRLLGPYLGGQILARFGEPRGFRLSGEIPVLLLCRSAEYVRVAGRVGDDTRDRGFGGHAADRVLTGGFSHLARAPCAGTSGHG